jgi:hypothetical protein
MRDIILKFYIFFLLKSQHMDIHPKNKLARPSPWISSQKNSAHGPGWAGLGRAGPGHGPAH